MRWMLLSWSIWRTTLDSNIADRIVRLVTKKYITFRGFSWRDGQPIAGSRAWSTWFLKFILGQHQAFFFFLLFLPWKPCSTACSRSGSFTPELWISIIFHLNGQLPSEGKWLLGFFSVPYAGCCSRAPLLRFILDCLRRISVFKRSCRFGLRFPWWTLRQQGCFFALADGCFSVFSEQLADGNGSYSLFQRLRFLHVLLWLLLLTFQGFFSLRLLCFLVWLHDGDEVVLLKGQQRYSARADKIDLTLAIRKNALRRYVVKSCWSSVIRGMTVSRGMSPAARREGLEGPLSRVSGCTLLSCWLG